jgi:hypothetical protein
MGTETFRLKMEPDVQSFIDGLAPVPRRQVVRDLEKLASRGLKALPPLTGPVKGHAYQKKDEKLPDHVRAEVMKRYQQLTGRKL